MSASLLDQQKLFGLFELDTAGTVLYSRIELDDGGDGITPDVAGRNFFNDIAPLENVEEFRRRISDFTRSEAQADSFHLSCRLSDGPLPVKVLLARICERSNGTRTKSILVHIRKI
ncbi:MAG: hypothetical protein QOF02_1085 [Blastocatellia bacterium]|jgi:hypothetical protein|nr:hypothetical protein [Blastocatellia bacterium]